MLGRTGFEVSKGGVDFVLLGGLLWLEIYNKWFSDGSPQEFWKQQAYYETLGFLFLFTTAAKFGVILLGDYLEEKFGFHEDEADDDWSDDSQNEAVAVGSCKWVAHSAVDASLGSGIPAALFLATDVGGAAIGNLLEATFSDQISWYPEYTDAIRLVLDVVGVVFWLMLGSKLSSKITSVKFEGKLNAFIAAITPACTVAAYLLSDSSLAKYTGFAPLNYECAADDNKAISYAMMKGFLVGEVINFFIAALRNCCKSKQNRLIDTKRRFKREHHVRHMESPGAMLFHMCVLVHLWCVDKKAQRSGSVLPTNVVTVEQRRRRGSFAIQQGRVPDGARTPAKSTSAEESKNSSGKQSDSSSPGTNSPTEEYGELHSQHLAMQSRRPKPPQRRGSLAAHIGEAKLQEALVALRNTQSVARRLSYSDDTSAVVDVGPVDAPVDVAARPGSAQSRLG